MRRSPIAAWAPVSVWGALLIFLGSRPGDNLPSPPEGFDKLAHMGFYGIFGLLVARATGRWLPAPAAGLLLGALDEWLQSGVAGRSASWADLAADLAGAALGSWLYLRVLQRTQGSADRS